MEVSGRRRPTLSEHMMGDSSALHDGRSTLAGLTLAAVLSGEGRNQSHHRPSSTAAATRTLLDIIKEEQASSATVYGGLVSHPQNKKSWKSFRDLLRHRRDAAAADDSSASSSGAASFSAVAHEIHQISRSSDPIPVLIPPESTSEVEAVAPVAMRLSAALEAEREAAAAPEGPRVSLMSLLERREVGPEAGSEVGPEAVSEVGPAVGPTGEEGEGEGGDDVAGGGGGGGEGARECVCCVCMVRHKGAAFIPCGHTFCRLCSRELWVSRGNCPLCNGYILEILDIF